MDPEALVKAGHQILDALDKAGIPPVFGAWIHNLETDVWKLWIVPPIRKNHKEKVGKEEFFLTLSKIISGDRKGFQDFDIGMIVFKSLSDRVVELIGRNFKAPGFTNVYLKNCTFDGFLIEECVIVRSDL